MTISSTDRKAGPFAGDGSTTVFPYAFKVFATSDLYVVKADSTGAETVLALTTHYTATMNGNQDTTPGGNVTLLTALAVGETLIVTTRLDYLQGVNLTNQGGFYPTVINSALDRLVIYIQQLSEQISRGLKTAITTPDGTNVELPAPVAYNLIGWNATADGLQNADPTYSTALATDLANTSDTSKGDALIGFKQSGTGATARTVHAKLGEVVSVKDFGAVGDGVADDTAAIQAAITACSGKVLVFPSGHTFSITGNITVPGATYLWIETGCVVSSSGRFTSYAVDDVTWQIDGVVMSTGMSDAPQLSGWPLAGGKAERGFIEFGSSGAHTSDGFRVFGKGKVQGDWTGTPNITGLYTKDVNCKGIACWGAKNVIVSDLDVSGFWGEAVYAYNPVSNVQFMRNYVHNTKFNALNFNSTVAGTELIIADNVVHDCYQGIESSVGSILRNVVRTYQAQGIFFGVGGGADTIKVIDNVVSGGFGNAYYLGFSSTIYNIEIRNNTATDCYSHGFWLKNLNNFTCTGNVVNGWGYGAASSAIVVDSTCANGVIDNFTANRTSATNGTAHDISSSANTVKLINHTDNIFGGGNKESTKIKYAAITDFYDQKFKRVDYLLGGLPSTNVGPVWYATSELGSLTEQAQTYAGIGLVGMANDAFGTAGDIVFYARKATGYGNLPTEAFRITWNSIVRPGSDNAQNLGSASYRWGTVYAGTGTINTSDERQKELISDIAPAVLRAWGRVKYQQFKFKDAVHKKGDGARWHFGLVAQRVKEAFEDEGLNAFDYGLLCYDSWEDEHQLDFNEDGDIVGKRELITEAGDRYGIRYEEALALECAYLRSLLQ
jgi:hypothetical protein